MSGDTFDTFTEKARRTHGSKYTYLHMLGPNVSMVCPEHGEFTQRRNHHVAGRGCPKCGVADTKQKQAAPFDVFVEKARHVHGDKYKYLGFDGNKIVVECSDHGPFTQIKSAHLAGKGCMKCGFAQTGENLRSNKDAFVTQAKLVHGDKYDYASVVYNTTHSKVNIICPEHGAFSQEPASHMSGVGCPACWSARQNKDKAKDVAHFTTKATQVHGSKYDYSKAVYLGADAKLEIVCPAHGSFWQAPSSHTSPQACGCPGCNGGVLADTASFVQKASAVHGDRYDYALAEYAGSKHKVSIRCREHGVFSQIAGDHTQGKGCPECARGSSKVEVLLSRFVEAHGFDVLRNYRPGWMRADSGGVQELDIFVPEANLAIEFNGAAFHHSSPKTTYATGFAAKHKAYHYNKWKLCADHGVTLLSVYDFKWATQRDRYIQKILHHLKLDTRVYARKCLLLPATRHECSAAYAAFSLEGGTALPQDAQHIKLQYCGVDVMWMSYGPRNTMSGTQIEVLRIVTMDGVTVVGGVSRMLKCVPDGTTMFTTNDSGSVLGGDHSSERLRYWWVNPNGLAFVTRAAANRGRRERLTGTAQLPGESEAAHMERCGWVRVWDSGLCKHVIKKEI